MSNVESYYKALMKAQVGYLLALHDYASQYPADCCGVFNLKPSHLSKLVTTDKKDWSDFVNGLKNWVLTSKMDISQYSLFEYFLSNLLSFESISGQVTTRAKIGLMVNPENDSLDLLSKYQSVIFQNICLCAHTAPLFTKGLLFMKQSTIDLINDVYLESNKMHFIEPVFPFFIVNEQIDYNKFFYINKKSGSYIEQALFSIAS
ncbi:hypothetical protein [Shewanella frigidimarina]|uniref:hypothetical protein n=1 Tax=Shewanella frigidimarina TaxID=56812 RepID=UPI003D7B4CAA